MRQLIRVIVFAIVGAALGFAIMLAAVLIYSPEWPSTITIRISVIIGTLGGIGAALVWGKKAVRWLIEALTNL